MRETTFSVYLLVSERGEVYTGHSGNLRARLRSHNRPNSKQQTADSRQQTADSRQWTRGRRWRLLAVQCFQTRAEAMRYELRVKRNADLKREWMVASSARVFRLVNRYGFGVPKQISATGEHIC